MKKSLLALAVLTAVTGAASAQSSVTLYGKVDLGLVLDSGAAAGKSVRLDSGVTGGSRIGFKGVEDLGGGMKAAFQLETGYCADSAAGAPNFCTGSNQFMGRQAYGALSGSFGSVSAGRQYSLGFNNLSTIDPFGTGFAGQVNNIVDPSGIRLNNSATYNTPTIGGVTASAEIAFGEQVGNWQANRETGAGITYASGPVYLGATYYDVDNAAGTTAARKNYLAGGTYDLGVVKLHALVQKSTGVSLDVLDVMGGLTIPVGGGSLMGSYIHHNDRTAADKDANQIGVGYLYPLSKRTSVYTAYARIKNDNGAVFTVGNATAAGTGDKAFNLGVVHNF
jgi:predicted porin